MRGTPLGDRENPQFDFGPPCFLNPSEVKESAKDLIEMPKSALRSRFYSPEFMEAAKLQVFSSNTSEEIDYVMFHYQKLVNFFQDAAKSNEAIIFYIT